MQLGLPRQYARLPVYECRQSTLVQPHQMHNGLQISQLEDVLGHSRMETTYKYVHLDRTNLRAEMEQGAL